MERFPYSLDNKRYHTFNYYLKTTYKAKVAKVILDGGFSCPNRDGTAGWGGCIFCSLKGSGDSNSFSKEDLLSQYEANKQIMDRKWPNRYYIPYFQSFSNTYGPLQKIKAMIEPFLEKEEVVEISLATRPDCLEEETIQYLSSLTSRKVIWLELGLQSSKDETGLYINRGHDFRCLKEALYRLSSTDIKVCLHIIDSLPFETKEDMIQTARDISHLPFDAIKIHMLHIIKDTKLAQIYQKEPFSLLSRGEYIETVIAQLELLPASLIIERLTGDPVKEDLIAPSWVLNKTNLLNDIDKKMKELDTWQGKYYE